MATAAPHVKLLRQLASAKDDYLSGAFDISWDGAKATLYLVFGRPSHAVFDTDQAQIEGEAAIDALLAELPRTFVVSDWRRAMSPHETLSISIDELAGPFVRLAGSYADDPISDEDPEWWSSDDSSPDLAFGLADFPLLPGGRPLWAETSPENVNLAERLATLPPSILILTGAKLRAAAVVSGGDIIDAVWIDDEDQARGEAAGMAMLGATKGSLAGYALDDPRVAESLTMLWRLPRAVDGVEMAWLDPASMLAAFRADGLDRVLVINAPVRGIALFSRGGLVAVYSETQRSAVASPERLRSLLSQARGRLTVMERKPRPVAAGAAHTIPSAVDFFAVGTPQAVPEPEAVGDAEPAAVAGDAASTVAEPASDAATLPEPAAAWSHPFLREQPTVTVDEGAGAAAATEPDQAAATEAGAETDPGAEVARPVAGLEPVAVAADAQSGAAPTETGDAEAEPVTDHPDDLVAAAPASDDHAPLPPPPGEDSVAVANHPPPPPAPEAAAEPARKAKRPWWAFGTRRRSSRQAPSEADRAAAEAAAAREAAEAAAAAGWGIRQPDAAAPPPWARPRDQTLAGTEHAATGFEAPPPAPDAAVDDTAATQVAPTWSVIEPGTGHAHWPAQAPTEKPADEHDTEPAATHSLGEVEEGAAPETTEGEAATTAEAAAGVDTSADEPTHAEAAHETETPSEDAAHEEEPAGEDAVHAAPAAAAAPTWSAREAIADSVSWYPPTQHTEVSSEAAADAEHRAAAEHETDAVHSAAEDGQTGPVAEADHESPVSEGAEEASIGATEHEPAAEEDLGHVAEAHPGTEAARDFWAEFATPDHDAEDTEPEPITASDATAGTAAHADDTHTEEESDAAPEPTSESGHGSAAEDAEPWKRKPSERTFAPWSWPLAEAETPPPAARAAPIVDETREQVGAEAATGPAHLDTEADADSGAEQGFFQRDEPVGSQFVDFDEVRKELVQIGVVWLGERNAGPVTALLTKTRSTIDDFVATIDTIRGLHVEGQDPASIQAMAREMHQQAAERLCGA